MFDRLVGLETEYVLRFHPREPGGPRTPNSELFARLLAHLQARIPVVPAIVRESGWFLKNGGGLRFERLPFFVLMPAAGFVEGATPECRGPSQLLRYQRAQDVLLSRHAAGGRGADGDVALLKSSHDGRGHFFGSHENYEATVGSGSDLLIWRLSLAVALPLLFLLVLFADLASVILIFFLSALVQIACRLLAHEPGKAYEGFVAWLICLCRVPVQCVGAMLTRHTAFRRVRRQLLPFLITRTIIVGPGMVCADGRFVLSPRAASLRSLCGLTVAGWRSVFYFCHIIKAMCEAMLGDSPSLARLFHRRQRLQITIGDSNMAQFAEYLKIGTTLLVLDAIDAGELEEAPRLRRPLQALRAISADPRLRTTVRLADGSQASALAIQRFYLQACRRLVKRTAGAQAEAQRVLSLWEETLDALEEEPAQLIGKLDWITKMWLLDGAGPDASVEKMRKLDARYHELSQAGYYLRLEAAGVAPTMVDPEEVVEAMAAPPEGTPATKRGRLIAEYAGSSHAVRASWSSIIVPAGSSTRSIRLSE